MRSVLIADDEENICWLIRKLIDWEGLGLSFAGMAFDGRSAFEMIQTLRPDIVITDVRMPDLDGLEMIRQAKDTGIESTFIVVSGHKEFEYAYSALKYGVEDYLLKPVKKKELNGILQKITSRMAEEESFAEEEQALRKKTESQQAVLQKQFIRNYREVPQIIEPVEEINRIYGLHFQEGSWRVTAVKTDVLANCIGQVRTDFVTAHLEELLREGISQCCREVVLSAEDPYLYAVMNGCPDNPEQQLQDILRRMEQYAQTMECYRVSLSVSDQVSSIAELPECIREAELLLKNRIIKDRTAVLKKDGTPVSSTETNQELLSAEQRNLIRKSIETFEIDGLRNVIRAAFTELAGRNRISATSYYRLADLIAQQVFGVLEEHIWGRDYVADERRRLEADLDMTGTVYDLRSVLTERLVLLLEHCKEEQKQITGRPVRVACVYMEEHLSERLSLEQTAEMAGLSPAYFSQLFKQETGVTFSDYLTDLRIRRAKELLLQSDETVAAIMEAVGYRDIKHFRNLFAERVGVTPAKYRKLHA